MRRYVRVIPRRADAEGEFLREKCGHKRARDHYGHEDSVLALVDDFVLEPKERGDRAEGEPGRHEKGSISGFALAHEVHSREWPDPDGLRHHFE